VKRRKRLAHDGVDIAAQPVAQARERFRADFVGLEDGQSAARLVDAVFAPRGDG
jgi:hypothetical protein